MRCTDGVLHKVAIECKNLSRNVELGHVRDFAAVLSDIPGLRGIMVTSKGFARGAKKYVESTQHQPPCCPTTEGWRCWPPYQSDLGRDDDSPRPRSRVRRERRMARGQQRRERSYPRGT